MKKHQYYENLKLRNIRIEKGYRQREIAEILHTFGSPILIIFSYLNLVDISPAHSIFHKKHHFPFIRKIGVENHDSPQIVFRIKKHHAH